MRERKKNKGSGAAAAVVLVLALLGQIAEGGGAFILIPLLAVAVIGGVLGVILGKKHKKAAPLFTPKKKQQEPCEFGKANHEFSHDANRRITQLDGFYKDGLIDRKEYELLKQRWSGT